MLGYQQHDEAMVNAAFGCGSFVDPTWSYGAGAWNNNLAWSGFNDFSMHHLCTQTSHYDARSAHLAANFELNEDAPVFVPPPPGLGVSDGCSLGKSALPDMQPLRIDLAEMASSLALAPPGLPPPPGLERALGSKAASTPMSQSTMADSFGEDLQSTHSGSSDEADTTVAGVAPQDPTSLLQVPIASTRVDIPRELRVVHEETGEILVVWPVDARKLNGKDRQIISSCFELFPGVGCKLMIKPKPKGFAKGLSSFQKARGCGSVELKIVEGVEKVPAFSFCLSVGSGDEMQGPRGPVEQRFESSSVCGLPREEEDWDFKAATDEASNTFLVSLQVLP